MGLLGSGLGILAALSIALSIYQRYLIKKKREMNRAAFDIMKEDALTKALMNPRMAGKKEDSLYRLEEKTMIQLETDQAKKKINYIFDPEKTIRFGRNPETSDVCLKDSQISGQHCIIFINNGQIWIKDVGSSNGTIVNRKGKNCKLRTDEAIILKNKDNIWLGSICFKVCLFHINKKYL